LRCKSSLFLKFHPFERSYTESFNLQTDAQQTWLWALCINSNHTFRRFVGFDYLNIIQGNKGNGVRAQKNTEVKQ